MSVEQRQQWVLPTVSRIVAWVVVIIFLQGCVTSLENGDEPTNTSAVTAGGYHLAADTTVYIDVWDPFAQNWQALTTTQSSVDPSLTYNDEQLFGWSTALDLTNAGWWSGPGISGEARLRFQGRSNGSPYNMITFEDGGVACTVDKVFNHGETFTAAGYACRSPQTPVINLRAHSDLTTVYLVRHAEKAAGFNPPLSPEGQARAEDLAEELAYAKIEGIITSQYLRTQQTAAPLAADLALAPVVIDANNYVGIRNYILANHLGGRVLVVGHSNTIDDIITQLGAVPPLGAIPDNDYDNLFLVHRNEVTAQKSAVQRTYGVTSP